MTAELLGNEDADCEVLYDLPMDIAEAVTGYRDDASTPKVADNRYELLIAGQTSEGGSTGGWWKRLFSSRT